MKTKTLEDTLRELQSQKMDSMEENKGLKEKNEDLQDLEFQYEELKLKYEEQEERTEKFRVMAKEKIEALQNEKNDLDEAKTELETQIDQVTYSDWLINTNF